MHPPETERPAGWRSGRLGTRLKLLAAAILIITTASLPRHLSNLYLFPAGILLALWPSCQMPLLYTFKRLALAELFIVGIALLTLLRPASAPVFLSAMAKSNLCVFTMLLLTWTTPFHKVLRELRRWRFPSIMLTTLALMYRYAPVLGEESRRMVRARASRTFCRRRRIVWNEMALIIGQLFIRTADRAERIYLAMCARGWK